MSPIPPVRREIVVDAGPDVAFRVFTERIGQWWPLEKHSVFGEEASVSFDDNQLVEVSSTGERVVWGSVTQWRPGQRLAFTWHPGRDAAQPTSEVTVSFTAVDSQTLVTLVHHGWEAFADPAAARAEYDEGWPTVLAWLAADIRQAADDPRDDTATWVALMHSPGPAAPTDGSLFTSPQFAEHVAFLDRMRAKGYLVAAGPLLDTAGAGMTILRLPGAGRLEEAVALATQDDASVASGFFTLDVRPWQVMLDDVR